ncbi:MAG: hypothetical protein GQ534_01295 [Candidatus Delongbacteria bacterium]|nr:hypothetical protein [Candidatus Delongbacteria bacterium]
MNLTIRNIPDDVISKIRTLSKTERRSLNNEILIILERGVEEEVHDLFKEKRTVSKNLQIEIWKRLAKEWKDDRSTDEIIKDIYDNRTLGRDFSL